MAFLIVDPDLKSREAAAKMVIWVDRRHRVDFAENGASALSVAIQRRPRIVFIEPSLPDIAGEQLCQQLRQRLPRLTCVALSNSGPALKGFDSHLGKPPSRFEVLAVIEQAKQRGMRMKAEGSSATDERRRKIMHFSAAESQKVTVYLSFVDESLKFGIPVPVNATLATVLKQLGKAAVPKCVVMRQGRNFGSDPDLRIRDQDHLVIRP